VGGRGEGERARRDRQRVETQPIHPFPLSSLLLAIHTTPKPRTQLIEGRDHRQQGKGDEGGGEIMEPICCGDSAA